MVRGSKFFLPGCDWHIYYTRMTEQVGQSSALEMFLIVLMNDRRPRVEKISLKGSILA